MPLPDEIPSPQGAYLPEKRHAAEGQIIASRYLLTHVLGARQGTETFLGSDLKSGDEVVVKSIPTSSLSPGAVMRLEYEARLLREVRSPSFASVVHAGRHEERFLIVARYVPGRPLKHRLSEGSLAVRETFVVGRALLAALEAIHQRRVLHRGIRPANVIVDAGAPLSHATLVDFGPTRPIEADASLRNHPLEQALYASPEQAGSIDHDTTAASDLYSVGAVLFHCLAGRPPFVGDNVGSILFEHMTVPVPELRAAGVGAPRALEELIHRLLRKDPRDRYQSASAALADLTEIANRFAAGDSDPPVVIGAHDKRRSLTEPSFVSRTEQMHIFDRQLQAARRGAGTLVLLEGESGGGKTRLLEETSRRAAREGFWVLRGQGTSEVAQQPFRLLGGVVEGFLSAVRNQPSLVELTRERLGVYLGAVSAALPELADVLQGDSAALLAPEETGEARTILALSRFLDVLGTVERPVLLILDDCQWADELTYKLIRRWHAAEGQSRDDPRYVLMVAAFRSEEVSSEHLLRRIKGAQRLRLPPMTSAEVRLLVESMAGPLPDEVLDVVIRLAEGSPFMASAVLRGFVEAGALIEGEQGWRVEPEALAHVGSSSRAATFLARRLDLLPSRALELLCTGAVLGKEFELQMAALLADQSAEEAIAALDSARQRQLVWLRPDGAHCVFVHDKIRSAVLDRVDAARRQQLHHRAARYLLEHAPHGVSALAYHFDAAGDSEAAFPFALQAADRARAQHALEIAEQQYRIALRGATTSAMRFRVVEGLGDALMLRGRYADAGELFESAASLAEGSFARAEILCKLGELAFKRGDMGTAIDDFERALRLLGRGVPRFKGFALTLLLWEAFLQGFHTLLPWVFVHRVRRCPNDAERLTLRLLSNLAHGCWYSRSKTVALWAHLRGLNLGERYLPSQELAQAYSEHAPGMTLVGAFGRGVLYAQKSLEMRKSLGDLWGQGQSLVFHGITLYAASRFAECVEKCRMAIRILERMGDYWQVHMARYQIAASLYHLGDLRGAVEESQLNYHSGRELGDEQASGIILDVWARASEGHVPGHVLDEELVRPRTDVQGSTQVLLADGLRSLAAGNLEKAMEAFDRGAEISSKAGVKNAYTIPAFAWAATARRIQAERAGNYTPRKRADILRAGERAALRAIRASRLCRNDLAQSLRDYAQILAMQGRIRKARRAFQKSIETAGALQQLYQYAQSLIAMGRVGREVGWLDADDRLQEGELLLAGLRAPEARDGSLATGTEPVSLSLVDRFDTVLQAGRTIASALATSAIHESARAAASRLLRAEHCVVVPLEEGPRPVPAAADRSTDVPVSLHHIEAALRAKRAVSLVDEEPTQAIHAGIDARERSVLCVPMYVRGRAAACLYVTHKQVRGLFGPDEERLADFIATIAGAALENAEGFAELQQLNASLEQRVAERTAAAESRARELAASNRELERVASELRQAEEQLLAAKHAAETANEAKSRFLATMSHEIRTPMNGVLGMTELVLSTPLSDQQKGYVRIVKDSANALLMLLNDILDLSKIEAGRMELERIPCNLHDTVIDAARLLAVAAAQKGLELVCRVAPEVPRALLGDPNRLRQVIVNLVGNAVKFTQHGEVIVDVWIDELSGNEAVVHGAVEDTGIGIPREKLATIFEAFQQTDTSTTRRFGGTGLGLTISSQLVELMGGRMWAESELGRGSRFHFVVPFPVATDDAPPPAARPNLDATAIVLTPSPSARRVYDELLQSCGYRTMAAKDQQDLLRCSESLAQHERESTLLVMDLLAEDTSGVDLVAHCRHDPRLSKLPLLVLIPAGQIEKLERCQALGAEHCLIKPIKAEELARALRAATGQENLEWVSAGTATPPITDARPLRLLVADDSPVNQEVAAGLLGLRGHQVRLVNDGHEAVLAHREEKFDLIFMDVEMPEMDGLAATRAIREWERETGTYTPIVGLSAHALVGFREECLAAGMDGYVTKPIQPDELFRALALAARTVEPAACVG